MSIILCEFLLGHDTICCSNMAMGKTHLQSHLFNIKLPSIGPRHDLSHSVSSFVGVFQHGGRDHSHVATRGFNIPSYHVISHYISTTFKENPIPNSMVPNRCTSPTPTIPSPTSPTSTMDLPRRRRPTPSACARGSTAPGSRRPTGCPTGPWCLERGRGRRGPW